jgi:CHAT domain-containing protein
MKAKGVALLALFLLYAVPVAAQNSGGGTTPAPVPVLPLPPAAPPLLPPALAPHRPIRAQLTPGKSVEYRVAARAGEFLHIAVYDKSIDIAVSVIAPSGETVLMRNRDGSYILGAVSAIAEADGDYRIRLTPREAFSGISRYTIELTCQRPATAADRTRVAAEAEYAEALLLRKGDSESKRRAIALLQQAEQSWLELADAYERDLCVYWIGYLDYELSDYRAATDELQSALSLARQSGDRVMESIAGNDLGLVEIALGQYRQAADGLRQAVAIDRALELERMLDRTLGNLGLALYYLGDDSGAIACYRQALAVQQSLGDRQMQIKTLDNLGVALWKQKNDAGALVQLERALELEAQEGDLFTEARTLSHIGQVYSDQNQTEQALVYYFRALPIARKTGDGLGEAKTLSRLMEAQARARRPSLAILFGKQAVNRYQQLRQSIKAMDKATQNAYLTTVAATYRQLADLLITQGRLFEAEQVLGMLKAEEVSDYTRGNATASTDRSAELTASEEQTETVLAEAMEWQSLRHNHQRTAEEETRFHELSGKLGMENAAMAKYWAGLEAELPVFHSGRLNSQASAAQELLKQLPPGTVIVYTLVLGDRVDLIAISPDEMVRKTSPIKLADLARLVQQFRDAIQSRAQGEKLLTPAAKLYDLLVAPIAPELDAYRAKAGTPLTIAWSLDGILRYVAINALYDADRRGYLIERYTNVLFTPSNTTHLLDRPAVSSWRALGLGVSRQYESDLVGLPSVPGELRMIVHDGRDPSSNGPIEGRILLDDNFTEQEMENQLEQGYSLVHIASHFVLQPDNDKSYLLLGGETKGGEGFHLPLLQLETEQNISFDGVELLSLSACETGLTASAGDGKEVDSLAEVVRNRGARAVLATLWEINDASTGVLMADFYRRWTTGDGLPKADALRQAQLALLHSDPQAAQPKAGGRGIHAAGEDDADGSPKPATPYAHPYYWAPFFLEGNWR